MNKIISPITITPGMILSTNLTGTGAATWDPLATYVKGSKVLYENAEGILHNFEWKPPTEVNTLTSIGKNPKYYSTIKWDLMDHTLSSNKKNYRSFWLDTGPGGDYAIFDHRSGAKSSRADNISVTVCPGQNYNSVGLVGVEASLVVLTMTDPVDGVVCVRNVDLSSTAEIVDYYSWCFTPIDRVTSISITDLPVYPDSAISVVATDTGGTVVIGEFIIGMAITIGKMQYGSSFGIESYSTKTPDDQGVITLQRYLPHKSIDYKVSAEKRRLSYLLRVFSALESVPVLVVGVEGDSATIIFGFYTGFKASGDGPTRVTITYSIEELT